jgi:hypothetical protein
MLIDLRAVPADTRATLLEALGDASDALGVLLGALRAARAGELATVPLEKLGVVEALAGILRAVALRSDDTGRAALRDLLVALADARDDLAPSSRRSVDETLLDGDDAEWTENA